jgi:hypothetical protein
MEKEYCLVCPVAGGHYHWVFKANTHDLCPLDYHQDALDKYGPIFINRKMGWFPQSDKIKIVTTRRQVDFPAENDVRVKA